MQIKEVNVLMPANVSVLLENRAEPVEVFVMIHYPTQTLIIPDESQYQLVKDCYDEFVHKVLEYLMDPTDFPVNSGDVEISKTVSTLRADTDAKIQEVINKSDIIRQSSLNNSVPEEN